MILDNQGNLKDNNRLQLPNLKFMRLKKTYIKFGIDNMETKGFLLLSPRFIGELTTVYCDGR